MDNEEKDDGDEDTDDNQITTSLVGCGVFSFVLDWVVSVSGIH